jgi:hypothetical protein
MIKKRGTPAEPANDAKVLLLRIAHVDHPKRLGGSPQESLAESGLKGAALVWVQMF